MHVHIVAHPYAHTSTVGPRVSSPELYGAWIIRTATSLLLLKHDHDRSPPSACFSLALLQQRPFAGAWTTVLRQQCFAGTTTVG